MLGAFFVACQAELFGGNAIVSRRVEHSRIMIALTSHSVERLERAGSCFAAPRGPESGPMRPATGVCWLLVAAVSWGWFSAAVAGQPQASQAEQLTVLFLGDKGHHRPAELAELMIGYMDPRGVQIRYSEDVSQLSGDGLSGIDALVIFANIEHLEPDQEAGLIDYVESGGGLVAIHCASYCFLNSDRYIELVGGQFQRHGGEEFQTEIVAPQHPIMAGFGGFRSWDETYIHHRHNPRGRTVLEVRRQGEQARGQESEPWTWVREQGGGRVFYTAWGHDHRTWRNPGFMNLIERGLRWAAGDDPARTEPFSDASRFEAPAMTPLPDGPPPFEYTDVGGKIPNYTPGRQWGVQGEPMNQMQLPLPPQLSQQRWSIPVGFELQLVAAEPDLGGKPIAMTWDDRGRLWVCETIDYPNQLRRPGTGNDRIRICEDTTGDGRADRFVVFAENLSIPTSLVYCHGGVIVQDGTQTVFLKDIDGDDVADLRQVLITGWGMGDTHGGVSNLQYGPDNWIWGMQGYNHSEPVAGGRRYQAFRQGFWRFRVEAGPADQDAPVEWLHSPASAANRSLSGETLRVVDLEFMRATNNNTWGLGFSEEGLVFGSTANRNPSDFLPLPNRYYEAVYGWAPDTLGGIADSHRFRPITDKVRQVDHHGGYTAAAGHAIYTARRYPPSWWNRVAFVNGPTGHLVGLFVLTPDGAGFRSTSPGNLMASDDEWSAPIMAEVGPDGSVWVIDWYNYIVQHNPTPEGFETGAGNAYETDLRDKRHGRIYRLVNLSAASPEAIEKQLAESPVRLDAWPAEALVQLLRHPTMRIRLHAQRRLVELQPAWSDALWSRFAELLSDWRVDAAGLDVGCMHAIWTLSGLGWLDGERGSEAAVLQVAQVLQHPSPGCRRAALGGLPRRQEWLETVAERLEDADAGVRLAAWLWLADLPTPTARDSRLAESSVADLILAAGPLAGIGSDRWLVDGWTAAMARHVDSCLLGLLERDRIDRLPASLRAALPRLTSHLASTRPGPELLGGWLRRVCEVPPQVATELLVALEEGWPSDHSLQLAEADQPALWRLLEQLPVSHKGLLIRLAPRWGLSELEQQLAGIGEQLLEVAEDIQLEDAQRGEAAVQLIGLFPDNQQIVQRVLDLLGPSSSAELGEQIMSGLSQARLATLGRQIIDRLSQLTPAVREQAIGLLLSRAELTGDLLSAAGAGDVNLSSLPVIYRQRLLSHPEQALRERASELLAISGGGIARDRQAVIDRWLEVTESAGDTGRGQLAFAKHCANCHRLHGQGERIGPELTGMSVHPKRELLIHILDPNRSVEGNYRTYNVLTDDGLVLSGMLTGESRTSIELVDAQGRRTQLRRDAIESLQLSDNSLMPEGFEEQLSRQEMTDLLEYLTSPGRFVPMSLERVATAVSTRGLFHDGDRGPDRIVFDQWGIKQVGEVPFMLVDPAGDQPNLILLHGPQGRLPPSMPREVKLTCHQAMAAVHLLGGISGWGYPASPAGSTSLIVRLSYSDGEREEHRLINGQHLADYIRRVDVPDSEFAFDVAGRQLRYIKIAPRRPEVPLTEIELIKGDDGTAPMVIAITIETGR